MLGNFSRGGIMRVALWTIAISVGVADVIITQYWGRIGIYFLGGAVCLSLKHSLNVSVGAAATKWYRKGREHRDQDQDAARIIALSSRRP